MHPHTYILIVIDTDKHSRIKKKVHEFVWMAFQHLGDRSNRICFRNDVIKAYTIYFCRAKWKHPSIFLAAHRVYLK